MRPIHCNETLSFEGYVTFSDGSKLPSRHSYKNEWTQYDSMSEKSFIEYKNGCVFCDHEWNLLGNNELEIIGRLNRDRDGNYYTTRKVHKLTDAKYKEWEKKLADRARMAK